MIAPPHPPCNYYLTSDVLGCLSQVHLQLQFWKATYIKGTSRGGKRCQDKSLCSEGKITVAEPTGQCCDGRYLYNWCLKVTSQAQGLKRPMKAALSLHREKAHSYSWDVALKLPFPFSTETWVLLPLWMELRWGTLNLGLGLDGDSQLHSQRVKTDHNYFVSSVHQELPCSSSHLNFLRDLYHFHFTWAK